MKRLESRWTHWFLTGAHSAPHQAQVSGCSRRIRLAGCWITAWLAVLCLTGCGVQSARHNSLWANEASTHATPTPLLRPVPTFTATPLAISTATPGDIAGTFDRGDHPHGILQRSNEQVSVTLKVSQFPVPGSDLTEGPVLFQVPEGYRPPFPIWRDVTGQVVRVDGDPDPDHPDPVAFRLWVIPDGRLYYGPDRPMVGVRYLAFESALAWGTTLAANDRAVLEILDEALFAEEKRSALSRRLANGVQHDPSGRVTVLDLNYKWIKAGASLPSEIGQLTALTYLDLSHTNLKTRLPAELGQLRELTHLDLGIGVNVRGPIPLILAQLTALEFLNLAASGFSGEIPNELARLKQLTYLDLGHNQLTGPIPSELGQLTQLKYLSLASNELTGGLPPALGQLTQLQHLDLGNSGVTGPIPSELGQLTQLEYLYLHGHHVGKGTHKLTGPIPPELGQLTRLRELDLTGNQLTGLIPPELGQLAHLRFLYLSQNQLTGDIPAALDQLVSLQSVDLSGNPLTGCLPAVWQERQVSLRRSVFWGNNNATDDWPFCPE